MLHGFVTNGLHLHRCVQSQTINTHDDQAMPTCDAAANLSPLNRTSAFRLEQDWALKPRYLQLR